MPSSAQRLATVRTLALFLAGLALAVVFLSAWLRLEAAGLGCPDWPACYGPPLAGSGVMNTGVTLPRLAHRIVASTALILALVLAWCGWRPTPLPGVARLATATLLTIIALAALGPLSADPGRTLVNWLNITGGMLMLALAWATYRAARNAETSERAPPRPRLLRATSMALGITIALGAAIGASYTATACSGLLNCAPVAGRAADTEPPAASDSDPAAHEGPALLHRLHRVSAVLTLILLTSALAVAARQGNGYDTLSRKARYAALLIALATFVSGLLATVWQLPLALTAAHGTAAALLLAALGSLRPSLRPKRVG